MKISSQFVFSFLDAFPLGIIFLNKDDLTIFFANKFFCNSLQVNQTSLNGLQFSDISKFNLEKYIQDEQNFYRYEQLEFSFHSDVRITKDYLFTVTPLTIEFISNDEIRDLYVLILQDPNTELDQSFNPSYQEWIKATKENIALVIYTFESGVGPQTLLTINEDIFKISNKLNENVDFTITKMGLYLMTAIAQGLNQSEGLFGPLPVPFEDYNAIVYALQVHDKRQNDPRTNQLRYTLVSMIYPKKYERLLLNRRRIRSIILDYFQIEDISQIKKNNMNDMLTEILNITNQPPEVKKTKKISRKRKKFTAIHSDEKLKEITELYNKINAIHDFDKAVDEITKTIEKCIDFKLLAIFSFDKFTNELFLIKKKGYLDYKIKNFRINLDDTAVSTKVAKSKKTVLLNDVSKCDYYLKIDSSIKSNLCVPLKLKTDLLGVLIVESEKLNAFNQDDVNLLELLAEITTVVFDQHRHEILSHDLNVLLNRLMSIEDFNEAIDEIVRFAEILLNFTTFCILDYREEEIKFISHRGYGTNKDVPKIMKSDKNFFVNHVCEVRESVYVDNLQEYPSIPYYKVKSKITSEYGIPVILNNVVVGVVNLERDRPLDRYEQLVMETLANYAKLVWRIYADK